MTGTNHTPCKSYVRAKINPIRNGGGTPVAKDYSGIHTMRQGESEQTWRVNR